MTNLERIAELAMQLGARHLDAYGAAKSRHDFTQRQLLSCLLLKAYLKTTYRGLLEILATSEVLRRRLGLEDKLPTTRRCKVQRPLPGTGDCRGDPDPTRRPSRGGGRERHRWVKVSAAVLCGSLLPVGLVVDWRPQQRQTPGGGSAGTNLCRRRARAAVRRRRV